MDSIAIAIVLYAVIKYSVEVYLQLRYEKLDGKEMQVAMETIHRQNSEIAKLKEAYGE